MLITVNNSGDAFKAKYDGISYEFPTGGSATIPLDAARHIFGFGLPDKSEVLSKHGWLRHNGEMDAAMTRLNDFSFSIPSEIPNEIPGTLPEGLKQDILVLQNNINLPAEIVPIHNSAANLSTDKSNSAHDWHEKPFGKIAIGVVTTIIGACALYLIATHFGVKLN